MGTIPSYRKVYTQIKDDIKNGIYKPGDLLPTESELEALYSVSRTTVRKSISLLVGDGYLKVRQGRGTEVLDISTTQRLNQISSTTETLKAKGYHVTTQGMVIERTPANEEVAAALELEVGEIVFKIQRVQYADDLPIAIMTNYIRENFVPNLDKYTNTFSSLYAFLEDKYNIILKDATERITAVAADFTESQILRVPFGTPLLKSRRITYIEQGPFEYAIIKLIADKYEYSVYLQGRA